MRSSRLRTLKFTSCMAENAETTCREIVGWLGRAIGIRTVFVDCVGWEAREALLDAGEIDVCWICGLPYVWKADAHTGVELCAVPVMRGDRYANRPVYFSDVVVRKASGYRTFADLRGAHWAYNESRSHSGYYVVRHHLATLGEFAGYFGRATESGAHQQSLRMLMDGAIDASAIDSTVLEVEFARYPQYSQQVEVIATLGPSPMPPWVIREKLPRALRNDIRAALLEMHLHREGAAILKTWRISHFTAARDADYDPLRRMARAAETVRLASGAAMCA